MKEHLPFDTLKSVTEGKTLMQWREIPAECALFVVQLVTIQAQEINFVLSEMGIVQSTAVTSYFFQTCPCEQDISIGTQFT